MQAFTVYFSSGAIGFLHTFLAIAAMVTGWVVLARKKGNRTHRLLGYGYALFMLGLNGSALFIHSLFTFGPFHFAALLSLLTLCVGVTAPMLARRYNGKSSATAKRFMNVHYECMSWSYIGLLAAFFSEIVTRLPWAESGVNFALSVTLASITVCIVGGIAMHLRRPKPAGASVVH